MTSSFGLKDKTILITGASSGIGQQCAITCSELDAKVILLGRDEYRLKQTVRSMVNPSSHIYFSVDLIDYEQVSKVVKSVYERAGIVHGLINCAGISATLLFKLTTSQKMEDFFRVNVVSAFNLTRELCNKTYFSDGGSVIFLSSIMGIVGEKGKSLYGMTKGAIISGVRALACEYANRKIRVNAISPGAIVTPINEQLPHIADPDRRKHLEDMHLLGLGETKDVANACVFLLSNASKWVTGTNLVIDGGYTAK